MSNSLEFCKRIAQDPARSTYAPQTIWKRYEQVDKAVVSKARKEYKEYLERHGDE